MSSLTVVVAAVPALVDALRSTGQFANVLSVESTAGLRQLLSSGTLSRGVADKVFIFADSTPVDTEQSLPFLLSRLVGMDTPVIVVATSPAGHALVREVPGAGLLEGPLTLNMVLGAMSGHRGLPQLAPSAHNPQIALPGMDLPTPAPAAPVAPFSQQSAPAPSPFDGAAAPAASPFGQQSAPALGPQAPLPSPFGQQAEAAPAAPFGAQQQPAPSPFGAPQPAAAPFTQQSTPAPSPFGAAQPSASSPFGQPSEAAPASPFGAPQQPTTAPVGQQIAPPPSPFAAAQQAEAAPASPFGAQPQPFGQPQPSPFGQTGDLSSPFGAAQQAQPAPFGQAPPASPFGVGSGEVAAYPPVMTSPFGVSPAAQGGPFGAPAARVGADMAPRQQRRGFVITVAAPKGGTGKSSMSLNLAAYLGLRLRGTGRNVCLIDANTQQADAGKYLNAWTPNIEGLLKDPSAIDPDRIMDHLLHRPQLNMSALLGPASPEVANPLYYTGKRYRQILEALKPNFDYIIIDTPVAELYHDVMRDFAIPSADFIAVVATPNVITLMNTDSWLRQVTAPVNAEGMGVNASKIGIILNRAEDEIGIDEDEVRRELAEWRFLASIPETKEWKRCNNANEIVATRNYHDLNEPFSIVLAAATGEDLIIGGTALPEQKSPKGGLRRLFGGKKGGDK